MRHNTLITALSLITSATAALLTTSTAHSAVINPWKDIHASHQPIIISEHPHAFRSAASKPTAHQKTAAKQANALASQERLLQGDFSQIESLLTHHSHHMPLTIPLPNGNMATYAFTYDPIMTPALAAKYPDIRTYKMTDIHNPKNTGRASLSPSGVHAVFEHDSARILLDPKMRHNRQTYAVYYEKNAIPLHAERHTERVIYPRAHHHHAESHSTSRASSTNNNSTQVRKRTINTGTRLTTYRLAISASGEYTAFHGGTKADALAAITNTINRVNDVYQRDLSIRFELVNDNDQIIFTDADTDPFKNDAETDYQTNERVIRQFIGFDNVDVAHVFNTGGGGLASLGVVCSSFKTQGVTGTPNPTGDSFDYSYVAHELGHQMGAEHSFNGTQGACKDNRSTTSAWEPGSGSTIMSYAGICPEPLISNRLVGDNIQRFSSSFFHVGSIEQIRNVTSRTSCGNETVLINQTPIANAGKDHVIPANTPFRLIGNGTDPDATDTLSYIWEQYDSGTASNLNTNGSTKDLGTGALFRSYIPTSTPVRYMPRLNDVLDNTISRGEGYAQTDRNLTFNLTVRDGNGGVATDATTLTVKDTGRAFSISLPTRNTRWVRNRGATVTWDTAGTRNVPINCQQVDIHLDTGSRTFSQLLLANAPNTGSASVNVPDVATTKARIMVSCHDNVFFAVNTGDFVIARSGSPSDGSSIPSTPTDSGSGGGGSIPPLVVLLLLGMTLVSAGCKTLSEQPSQDIPDESAPTGFENDADIDVSITPESAVRQAIAHDDVRLFVTGTRLPIPVGIKVQERAQAKRLCGTRLLRQTGDVLRQSDDLAARNARIDYATRYNIAMYQHCKAVRHVKH